MALNTTVTEEALLPRVIQADQVFPTLGLAYDPILNKWDSIKGDAGRISTTNYVWDTGTLSWVVMTQPGGGGGGGGASTIADGADIVLGTLADAAIVTSVAGTVNAKLRGLIQILASVWNSTAGTLKVESKISLAAAAPATVSVGTSSAAAIAANATRKGLVIVNRSANTVSFGIGATAVVNRGITLTPNGTWVMDEYTFTTAAINAIASAAASVISVQEFS